MVFERFTKDARAAVQEAAREAGEQGAAEVEPLHLLTALIRFPHGGANRVLSALGIAADDVGAQAQLARRRGGISEPDAAALDGLGIDVDAIVSRVEQEHGHNALAGMGKPRKGHIPFADASKRTLERTLREVIGLGEKRIGSEHILLALASRPGPAADVLSTVGASTGAIRGALRKAS